MTEASRVVGTFQAASRALSRRSKLPPRVPPVHHLGNNLAAFPDTRLLHVGRNVSYVLWGNEHAKVHWIDEDLSTPRPDVAPYNLVVIDAGTPRALTHFARDLADEFILFVPEWRASWHRIKAELSELRKWEPSARMELYEREFRGGAFVGVYEKRRV
jgi:hypothetical protein